MDILKVCQSCGNKCPSYESICSHCGTDLTVTLTKSVQTTKSLQTAQSLTCPDTLCGANNPIDQQTCLYCGTPLIEPVRSQTFPENHKISYRPYIFNRQEFYNPEDLAIALAGEWENAIKHFQRGYLSTWFSGELMNHDLAILTDDLLDEKSLSFDKKLHLLLLSMNPSLLPCWKGVALSVENVTDLAKKSVQGDAVSYKIIKEIYQNQLPIIDTSSQPSYLRQKESGVMEKWRQKISEFEQVWSSMINAGIPNNLKPEANITTPALLLSCINKGYSEEIRIKYNSLLNEHIETDKKFGIIFFKHNINFCNHIIFIYLYNYINDYIAHKIRCDLTNMAERLYAIYKDLIVSRKIISDEFNLINNSSNSKSTSTLKEAIVNLKKLEIELFKIKISDIKSNSTSLIKAVPSFKEKVSQLQRKIDNEDILYIDNLSSEIVKIEKTAKYFNDYIIVMEKMLSTSSKNSSRNFQETLNFINRAMIDLDESKVNKAAKKCDSLRREWLTIGIIG